MDVFYYASLDYHQPQTTRASAYIVGADSLADARAELANSLAYYQTLEGGSVEVHKAVIEAHCANCQGAGEVRKLRGHGYKVCPVCKGKTAQVIIETWIDIPREFWR